MQRHPSLIPLSRQHHNGLALCVFIDRALASGGDAEVAMWTKKALDRYDLELMEHFAIEEEVVFPALLEEQALAPLIEQLTLEHHRMKALLDQMRAAPSRPLLAEFAGILRAHIRSEENELFQQAQSRVSPETLEKFAAAVRERAVEICLEP